MRGPNRFLFFLLLIFILLPLTGQAEVKAKYGLLAGWSRTDWDYESEYFLSGDLFDAKNGFQVGAYVEGEMSGLLGVRAELLYARKGAQRTDRGVDENGEYVGDVQFFYSVDYLQIPLLFTLDLVSGPVYPRPRIFLGPYVGYNMSAKKTVNNQTGDVLFSSGDTDLVDVEDADVGLVLGAGVDFEIGGHTLGVQVRYELGLTDVYYETKNQGLTVLADFGF